MTKSPKSTNFSTLNRRHLMLGAGVAAAAYASHGALAAEEVVDAVPEKIDLTGVSILITGCSSGFGRLGAEHYARLGAKVFATMRNMPRPEARELKQLAKDEKLDLTVLEIDVTDDRQVKKGVAKALKASGGTLDVLINNAGISIAGPIEAQDIEATHLIFDTNLYGPQRLIRAVMPSMRAAKKGQIFNVTSQLGRVIVPGYGQYSPTKFALEAMSEQLAYEAQPHGIEVTIIEPGGYPTKIWEKQAPPTAELKARLSEDVLAAYGPMTERMGVATTGGVGNDPMDIPNAIAKTIAMPKGTRPLRIALNPKGSPQDMINTVSSKTQIAMLGKSPYGPWIKDVLD